MNLDSVLGRGDADVVAIRGSRVARALKRGRVRERHENVAAIAEIHHALRDVDAVATHVHVAIDVELANDFAGVKAHPHGEAAFDLFRQLASAADRVRTVTEEDQRHAVAGRCADDFVAGGSVGRGGTIVDNVLQAAENGGLPIERKGRITDGVQEKNMRRFGLGIIQRRHGCSDKEQCLPLIAILTDKREAAVALGVPATPKL